MPHTAPIFPMEIDSYDVLSPMPFQSNNGFIASYQPLCYMATQLKYSRVTLHLKHVEKHVTYLPFISNQQDCYLVIKTAVLHQDNTIAHDYIHI